MLEYYNFTEKDRDELPVVFDILKELTPEKIREEVKEIQKVELPPKLEKFVMEYEKVADRDGYIWKWAYFGWHFFTLSCVDKNYRESVILVKMYCTMLNALVDDIADVMRDQQMLKYASDIIANNLNIKLPHTYGVEKSNYLLLIREIWILINKEIKQYPRYEEFENIFIYDYQQFLNAIQYSYLINEDPNLINLVESDIYSPHNMKMIIGATIDLMCSPSFKHEDTGVLREIVWNSQQMGRIGNLLATWEDEVVSDSDFTSGIFAYVLVENILNTNDLKENKDVKKIVNKIRKSQAEKYFLKKWEDCYNEIFILGEKNKLIDAKDILDASRKFLIMHLASRGLEV